MSIFQTLLNLPGSYQGPTTPEQGPFGLLGLGEAALAAQLCEPFSQVRLSASGTQFVLNSAETQAAADDFAALAEVSEVTVRRVGVGEGRRFALDQLHFLAPGGVSSTYHLAQYLAYATGHAEEAQQAEALLSDLRDRCAPEIEEGNPARDLAWTLWGRAPLLLAPAGEGALVFAWQLLLARIGKVLSVPVEREPLYVLTGAFEAHHERGDGRLALLLGEEDAELRLVREVLETRIDEVVTVPYPGGEEGYAGTLALWYFAAWVATYLAEREGTTPDDSPALLQVLASVSSPLPDDELN
ncbi:SIS domain-containing protein [Deinococcus sonorensis]|uniref:SIS domain-containing protein n=2 Tax=Deinococcus sonorensis TaxID=309891 RepID=A0AAU7U8D1_9DEIO